MEKTVIPKLVSRIVLAAIGVIESLFIARIRQEVIANSLKSLLLPIRNSVVAFADDNPRDNEQLEAIWRQYANGPLPDLADVQIVAALSKLSDPNLRAVLLQLTSPTVQVLRLVTDENPNNEKQIRELFDAFVRSDESQRVLLEHLLIPLLEARIKDAVTRNLIISLLRAALEEVV